MFRLLSLTLLATCCLALYSTPNVVELTHTNFGARVLQSDEIWIVEFYAPWCGYCKNLVPEYTKAADALKGVIKVGAVNTDEHHDLKNKYQIRAFPTIKIFGANKNKPEDFNGERTAQGLVDAALSAAKSKIKAAIGGGSSSSSSDDFDDKDVIELTDANFDKTVLQSDDMWLVEFFAPWCGHCKRLGPDWAKAASELKGKVKLGALDATVHQPKAAQYGIQGYPTIKFFGPGPKTSSSAEVYDGGRTASEIVTWALDKLSDSLPAPKIKQIINEESFNQACEQKPLCVVSVLPHILDCQSACRNEHLKILTDLGEKFKKKMWGWVWSEAGAQINLENAVDIGGFGYPAMAVINAKKMKYSILRGSFSKDGIYEFLRNLSYGKGNTAPVKGQQLPKVNKIEPWDGNDGELPQDEDIDLSDVVMDEKNEL